MILANELILLWSGCGASAWCSIYTKLDDFLYIIWTNLTLEPHAQISSKIKTFAVKARHPTQPSNKPISDSHVDIFASSLPDMNPTTDHFHVPERAITRSNTKMIQVSNQENNGVADIGK